jgi:hypothetical protein
VLIIKNSSFNADNIFIKLFAGNREGKRTFNDRSRREDNIKIDLSEIGSEVVDWTPAT